MIPALKMDHTINLKMAVGYFCQPLYRLASGLTRNKTDAAGLTQHDPRLRAPGKLLKGWPFTTLRRGFLRLARHQTRHPEVASQPGPKRYPRTSGCRRASKSELNAIPAGWQSHG